MSIRFDLREGRELGAPLCCILRYTLEYALRPDAGQAVERGIRFTAERIEYVPCRLLHKATLTHAEYDQLLMLQAIGGQ